MNLAYARVAVIVSSLFLLCFAERLQAENNDIARLSISSAGILGNGTSLAADVDGSGQLVVFQSAAENLVSGSINNKVDIFLHNRTTDTTTLLSQSSAGTLGNGDSTAPQITTSGNYVAFLSKATNLDPSDTNTTKDAYVLDRTTTPNTLTRAAVSSTGVAPNKDILSVSISNDGRYLAFATTASNLMTTANNVSHIYLKDRTSGALTRVSEVSGTEGNKNSSNPQISADGAFIVFESLSSNLVASDSNAASDVFVYNRSSGAITLVSRHSSGVPANGESTAPSISSDGRYVAFQSAASNLATDNNEFIDIFRYDLTGNAMIRVSVNTGASGTNGDSILPAISLDGSRVAYLSDATDIVSGDTNNTAGDGKYDVFVRNIGTSTSSRKSVKFNGSNVEGTASSVALNTDGKIATFASTAYELVAGRSSLVEDIYITDENCPTDSDSDGTADCSDECPSDAAKIVAGSCGCGFPETDSDSDGTKDCNDDCPSDSTKVVPGTCGCGTSDTDANANGVADCLDPTAASIPSVPTVRISNRYVYVDLPYQFEGVTYQIEAFRNNRRVKTLNTRSRRPSLGRMSRATYTLRYRVKAGNITSLYSSRITFKVR